MAELPKIMHTAIDTPDSRGRAEALGASLLLDRTGDEDEPLYVLADPSGHPFCIFVG